MSSLPKEVNRNFELDLSNINDNKNATNKNIATKVINNNPDAKLNGNETIPVPVRGRKLLGVTREVSEYHRDSS